MKVFVTHLSTVAVQMDDSGEKKSIDDRLPVVSLVLVDGYN